MSEENAGTELFDGPFDSDKDDHLKAIHLTTLKVLEMALDPDNENEDTAEANGEAASDLMSSVVVKGPWALYTSCLSLARTAQRYVSGQIGEGDGTRMWGFMDIDEDGEITDGSDAAEKFAAQFLVAYMNNDPHQCLALYTVLAEGGPEVAMDGHIALMGQVVTLMSRTLFTKVSEGDPLYEELVGKLGLNDKAPDDASELDGDAATESKGEGED